MYSIINSILNFILYVADLAHALVCVLIFLNFLTAIYLLYYHLCLKETVLKLSFNLFYSIARNSNSFTLSNDELCRAERTSGHVKTFLLCMFFLVFADMCSYHSLQLFLWQDYWYEYLILFSYLGWSYICTCKVINDKAYAFPLILNPIKQIRFRKRYQKFMKQAYLVVRFEKYKDFFLYSLSSRIKDELDWASSKNIAGENSFVAESLLAILNQLFINGQISESEANNLHKKISSHSF